MKKILLSIIMCLIMVNARAEERLIVPYIGLNISYDYLNTDDDLSDNSDIFDSFAAFNINAGFKMKYFAAELFYQQSSTNEEEIYYYSYLGYYNSKDELSWRAYGIDFYGFLPVGNNVELLGTFGIANYKFESKQTISQFGTAKTDKNSEDGFASRVGLGAQFSINEHVSFNFIGRVAFPDVDGVKNITEISIGAKYLF